MSDAALKSEIVKLFTDFTLEVVPASAAKIERFDEHVRPDTDVYVTFLPGSDVKETVDCAIRLHKEGFTPIPHFAARSMPSKEFYVEALNRVTGETGTKRALTIAGGVDKPLGPFADTMQLLDLGEFEKHGIETIGVAGHPEGSPDMSSDAIWDAVEWKNRYNATSSADLYIVTQFAFELEPIAAWDAALTERGNQLPVMIGVPGIATLKTLIKLAQVSGVGPSLRFLTRQARNVAKLVMVQAPDELVVKLAQHRLDNPSTNIAGVHMYPLGGLRRSALWAYAVADAKFELTPKGGMKVDVAF